MKEIPRELLVLWSEQYLQDRINELTKEEKQMNEEQEGVFSREYKRKYLKNIRSIIESYEDSLNSLREEKRNEYKGW